MTTVLKIFEVFLPNPFSAIDYIGTFQVGHNFNLWHANDEVAYNDHTGYMSGSITGYHDQKEFPANCFNAANHWEMGWFRNSRITVNADSPAQIVKVAPFVDYRSIPAGTEYKVLVEISNRRMYAHFNKAKSYNQDTHDHKDKLVIVREDGDGTELISALAKGQSHSGVEVCDTLVELGSAPEHMVLSIGSGSACKSYFDSLTANQQQEQGGGGACRKTMAACVNDSDCCSNRCSSSSNQNVRFCSEDPSKVLLERKQTPGRGDGTNRKRGN